MNWFEHLAGNPHIQIVLLINNQGRLLKASRPINGDSDLLPSMLQAFEVLAQTLTAEFACGAARTIQISSELGHIFLYPLLASTYYVAVTVARAAPLMLVTVDLERTLRGLRQEDFDPYEETVFTVEQLSDLDAGELIEAVREWLRQRPAP